MVARLSIYENVDLELAARLHQWMEAAQADPFARLPGYRGSMTLIDRDNARLVGIGFHSSAGHAEEADTLLGELFEQARTQMPDAVRPAQDRKPDTVGVYELVHRD